MTKLTRVVAREVEKLLIKKDENGKEIKIPYKVVENFVEELSSEEEAAIRKEWKNNELEAKRTAYINGRKREYPALEEQLDTLYHEGFEGWKAMIQKIKDKYPKT